VTFPSDDSEDVATIAAAVTATATRLTRRVSGAAAASR
jgi:hypothetical protein